MQGRRSRLSSQTVVAGGGRKGRRQKEEESLGVLAGTAECWERERQQERRCTAVEADRDGLSPGHWDRTGQARKGSQGKGGAVRTGRRYACVHVCRWLCVLGGHLGMEKGRGDVSGAPEPEQGPLPLLTLLDFTSNVYVLGIVPLIFIHEKMKAKKGRTAGQGGEGQGWQGQDSDQLNWTVDPGPL